MITMIAIINQYCWNVVRLYFWLSQSANIWYNYKGVSTLALMWIIFQKVKSGSSFHFQKSSSQRKNKRKANKCFWIDALAFLSCYSLLLGLWIVLTVVLKKVYWPFWSKLYWYSFNFKQVFKSNLNLTLVDLFLMRF